MHPPSRYLAPVGTPRRRLEAVSLDLGNTLVGMDPALVCEALAEFGIPASAAAFRRAEAAARPVLSAWIRAPQSDEPTTLVYVRAIVSRLAPEADPALPAALLARLRGVPTERLWSAVLPGVPQALGRLRAAGFRLVVVSNSDGSAERGLVGLGLRDLVDAVVDSAVFGVEKPDPRIFAHALERVDARPERTLHAGDLYDVDVVGARDAGVHAALLDPYGDWPDVDCEVTPDLVALARTIVEQRR